MRHSGWIIAFCVALAGNIAAEAAGNRMIELLTKPLLMPFLATYFILATSASNTNGRAWIILALFFSWCGDVMLLFQAQHPSYFLFGLGAFLVAQVCFIIFFHGIRVRENIRGNALLLLLVVVYYSILMSILSPFLGELKLPVRIYGVVLSFMALLAMHVVLGRHRRAGAWMMTGAILFVISDTLLALNKFYLPLTAAGPLIMLTYGLAQLGIVRGAATYLCEEWENR